jgi:hypothetical protein
VRLLHLIAQAFDTERGLHPLECLVDQDAQRPDPDSILGGVNSLRGPGVRLCQHRASAFRTQMMAGVEAGHADLAVQRGENRLIGTGAPAADKFFAP